MNVLSKPGLLAAADRHPDARGRLAEWHAVARRSSWLGLNDVRRQFPSADQVGNVLIFNIKGNRYRLITQVNYRRQRIYVRELLSHAEYDKKEWMKWV